MARKILDLFGRLAMVLAGFAIVASLTNFSESRQAIAWIALPSACGVLLLGAMLVGFARAIELLEQIEKNTSQRG